MGDSYRVPPARDPIVQWPRTLPFHGSNTGSNPVRVATLNPSIRGVFSCPQTAGWIFRTVCPCLPAVTATRNKDFPITIKAGSSAVKIYTETKPNGEYYRVCYYAGGKRERLTFSSLEEAKTEARRNAALLARGDSAALELTGQDRLIYGRAIDAVRPFNPSSAVWCEG